MVIVEELGDSPPVKNIVKKKKRIDGHVRHVKNVMDFKNNDTSTKKKKKNRTISGEDDPKIGSYIAKKKKRKFSTEKSTTTKKIGSIAPVNNIPLMEKQKREASEMKLFEDDAFSSDDDELPVEKKSKKLAKKAEKDRILADDELHTNIINCEVYSLPSMEEIDMELKTAPNLQHVRHRIAQVFQVLADFRNRRQSERSREEYIQVLTNDLCTYYGYSHYLMGKFIHLFTNGLELMEFLDANAQPRPTTIRSNSLKIRRGELARSLINRGMNVDPAAKWTKVGLVVYDSQVPVGATPEYLSGQYTIQGLSSLLPVMALAPKANEKVLDMCAAPGGKSSHIAALMNNTGVLFANDSKFMRCKAIVGNLHRLGVNNCVVSNLDGRSFAKVE